MCMNLQSAGREDRRNIIYSMYKKKHKEKYIISKY